jgi:hypothetical protein
MIRKYLSISALLALVVATGCQKLNEDPKGSLTPVNFSTQKDLDAAVAGIYEVYAYDGSYGFTSRMTSYFGADDLTTDPGLNKADMRDFDRLNGGSSNGSMNSEWEGPWKGIYNANGVIANYPNINSTDELKNRSAGQAYFLRAWGYYMLVRTFGPVPLILEPIDADLRPPREEVSKIYDAIISDLKTAKSMLPAPNDPNYPWGSEPGRANQFAARAMLADVYLTMTGWPINQASNYALAATEADSLIQESYYDLNTPYDKVFSTNGSTESIFSLYFKVSGNLPQRAFGSSCVPLDESGLDGSGGWDDYYPEINFYLNAPACTRTDATFYTTIKLKQSDNTFNLVPWSSNQTHAGHPYFKKFRAGLNSDGVKETNNTILSINPSTNKALDILRYPLVLLDYAEASAMAAGAPTVDSYAAINKVRQRAGLPDLVAGLSATDFRDSVVFERGYEFAGEFGIRWFDIVRLQILPAIIAQRSPLENPIIPADINTRYLAPIPFNEMLRNPGWTQNAGY